MRSRLAAALALSFAQAVAAAIVSGPEQHVSTASPAASRGEVIHVATDGRNVLTLWFDRTAGREGIYATAVDDRGVPLPGNSPKLTDGWGSAFTVWTGDHYLVVASSSVSNATFATILDRDGNRVAGPSPLDVGGWPRALAWNGSRALMVIHTPSGMRGVLLGPSGEVLRSGITLPATVPLWQLTVAAAGSSFVVAWAEEDAPAAQRLGPVSSVYAMGISANGTTGATVPLLRQRTGFVLLDSASSGDRAGVAAIIGANDRWHIAPFTFDGDGSAPEVHAGADVVTFFEEIDVVATPAGFATSYLTMDRAITLLAVVDFEASVPRTLPLGTIGQFDHEVISNVHTAMVVAGGAPLLAIPLDPGLSVRTHDAVAAALAPAARQSSPIITPGAGGALVTWIEPLYYGQGRVVARRFDRAGKALDVAPIVLGEKGIPRIAPAVAFTGSMWLVAWQEDETNASHVLLRRLSADGTLLDPAPTDLGIGFEPIAASNGKVALIITADFREREMNVLRYSTAGVRLDATTLSNPSAERSYYRAIATNGSEFLIAWAANGFSDVLGRRLDSSGAPIETAPIAIATGPDVESHPAVGSDGGDFLVVYSQQKPVSRGDPPIGEPEPVIVSVRSKRLMRTGFLADHAATQNGYLVGRGANPRVAWNGRHYLVTSDADDIRIPYEGPQPLTLSVVPLSSRGMTTDNPHPFTVGDWVSQVHSLALVEGAMWTAYPRVTPELGNVERVYLRELAEANTARRRTSRK